jgi:hypothetical protein
MHEKINTKCYKCEKDFAVVYSGKTVFRKCSGCNRKNRVDGSGESKPAYVLSPRSRIGASQ